MNLLLCLLLVTPGWQDSPIKPTELRESLAVRPDDDATRRLEKRIRASFPKDLDLTRGGHLIEGETVAFVIDAPEGVRPRVGGDFVMLNRGRGYEMKRLDGSPLWVLVETIPGDTRFAYRFELGRRGKVGGSVVEMPDWKSPPESLEVAGRKYGEYLPWKFRSTVFNNDRTGWIYVPAAYDGATPAALMIFQDGDAYKGEKVGTVVENLIAEKAMPVTIVVGLNPGVNDDGKSNRSVEYDSLGPKYASFLEKEVLPELRMRYKLIDVPAGRAIGGASSGGICAFTVAWERPELFGRVCSQIGSFTNIRGGHVYPDLVKSSPKKPIRVVLHDGSNDLINRFGDWWEANQKMFAALKEAGYQVDFLTDRGFHSYWSCGRVLPEALRRTWKDQAP